MELSRRTFCAGMAANIMSFESNGVDQRTCDMVLRPQPLRGDDITTLAGRTQVDPSILNTARTVMILHDGQSTNNNTINTMCTPANPLKMFNLSIGHRGACFIAVEPLLSSNINLGHGGMYLADQLIADGACDKVIIVNVSIGGSCVADHSPQGGSNAAYGTFAVGELAYRIGLAARCIANSGLSNIKTVIDWQQGEWDSDSAQCTQASYTTSLNGVIAEYKRVGLLRAGNVMFINQCTRIGETAANRNPIRAAQLSVVDGGLVRFGCDADSLDLSNRWDTAHFTAYGSGNLAGLKKVGIKNYLLNG